MAIEGQCEEMIYQNRESHFEINVMGKIIWALEQEKEGSSQR